MWKRLIPSSSIIELTPSVKEVDFPVVISKLAAAIAAAILPSVSA